MIDDITKRAEAGDPEAQAELAHRYLSGEGVNKDLAVAMGFLSLAAQGGNPWAQTEYARNLRSTKLLENEVASVYWLNRACEQKYSEARYLLAASQFNGVGTPIDLESAMANCIMASLDGHQEAKEFVDSLVGNPTPNWRVVFDKVHSAQMSFFMGPLVDGHFEELTSDRLENPYNRDAMWMGYERTIADSLFLSAAEPSPLFSAFFEAEVFVEKLFTTLGSLGGEPLAIVNISLRDIKLENGFPVYWRPDEAEVQSILPTLSNTAKRKYVRFVYSSF